MPNETAPSLTQHFDGIAASLRDMQRNTGYTGVFEAFLGKGDGKGTILAPTGTFPLRQVWYHYYDSNNIKVQGLAPLGTGCDIYYANNASYEGLPIKVGYPPKQLGGDKLTVFGVSGASGQGMLGNQTSLEQTINAAASTGIEVATTDGVTSGSGILQLLVPPGSLTVNGTTATLVFPTASSGGGGGGGGIPTTPSYLPPLLVNTLLQYQKTSNQSLTASTANTIDFDQILLSQNVVGTPVTTGASWSFTAPIEADYYIAYLAYFTLPANVSLAYWISSSTGYVLTNQGIATSAAYSTEQLTVVHLAAGATCRVVFNPAAAGASININSVIEIGWNQVIPGAGSPTVIKKTVTSATTSFATTQLLSLPPNATITSVRVITPSSPGTLATTVGVVGGSTTAVTSTGDVNLLLPIPAFIPTYYVNSTTSAQNISAYFSGVAGLANQNIIFILEYV